MNRPSKTPDPASLRNRALGYLARREHSRAELAHKLATAGYEAAAIAPLLDQFEEKGWLSDRRFAESWVADHRARDGDLKLRHDLRARGVDDQLIAEALASRSEGGNETQRAGVLWQKKFGTPPASDREKARQMRYLAGRGFSAATISLILKNARTPDAD